MTDLRTAACSLLPRRHSVARAIAMASAYLLLGAFTALPGCGRPLLAPDDERSPFDRYDTLRNQSAPQTLEDPFGRKQPNLRGRLAPRTD